MNAQETRSDGWQHDVADRNRTIAVLAADRRQLHAQTGALQKLARTWRHEADACISMAMAQALRGCADQVDAVTEAAGQPVGGVPGAD